MYPTMPARSPWSQPICWYDSGARSGAVEIIETGRACVIGARTISATGKATICNMGAEVGATTSLFPYDEHMAKYLHATNRGGLVPIAEKNKHLLAPDAEVEANPEKYYERVLKLDLSTLDPPGINQGIPRFGVSDF